MSGTESFQMRWDDRRLMSWIWASVAVHPGPKLTSARASSIIGRPAPDEYSRVAFD
jgi:hypothetical protein